MTKNEIKVKDVLEAIKETGERQGIIKFDSVHLKLSPHDKKAIEVIEELQDCSMGDGIEILQTAILWLGMLGSMKTAEKEIENENIMFEVILRRNEKCQ